MRLETITQYTAQKMTFSNNTPVDVRDAYVFLAEYAAWLLGCGATCIRITKNVTRIAEAWNLKTEITIMPSSVHLSVFDNDTKQSFIYLKRKPRTGISFYKNTRLSELSWAISDAKVSFEEARERFNKIITAPYTNKWLVLVLTSLANMSFCRLFGGDPMAMFIVFVATFAGFRLKQMMLEDGFDDRVVFLVCSFFSAVIGSAGYVFHIGTTPELAVGTSVLYLVPGIPYINSLSDMLDGHYLVSFSRFMGAAMLTFCLSCGLAAGMLLMNLKIF